MTAPSTVTRFVVEPSTRGRFRVVDTATGKVTHDGYAQSTARRIARQRNAEETTTAPELVFDVDWPMPDDLVLALVGLPNSGDYAGIRSMSDLELVMREAA